MATVSESRMGRLALGICGGLLLSSCAAVHVEKMSQEATEKVQAATQELAENEGLITATPDAYLAGEAIRAPEEQPAVLKQQFVWASHVPMSLGEAAAQIQQQDGVTVDVSEVRHSVGVDGGVVQVSNAPRRITLVYSGPLFGALNDIASQTQSWWRFTDGEVQFYRTVTKTFELAEVPQHCKVQSTISTENTALSGSGGAGAAGGSMPTGGAGGASGGSGSGNSAGVQASCEYELNAWQDLRTNLQSLAASASILVNQSAGTVTVAGAPDEVQRVAAVIRAWNAIADQQVEVTVHIYNIQLAREDNYGVSPNVQFQSLLQNEGWSMTGVPLPTAQTAPGTLGADILNNTGLTKRATGFNGTTFTAQALSTLGHVVDVYDNSEIVENGHPAIFTNTQTTGYLYEVSSFTSANVGQSSSLVPGTFTGGLTTVVTPRVVDGDVHVGLSFGDNTLTALVSRSSGGNTIQTPNYSTLATMQDAILKPGSVLLLTGFKGHVGSSTINGPIGGGVDAQTNKTMVAIVITARVL
jgi:type IVB pilus formation R64 PilN family outer membrane protein